MKTCSKCKEYLPLTSFHKDSSRKDGLCPQCTECMKIVAKEYNSKPEVIARRRATSKRWALENPERSKRLIRCAMLRKKYSITADEYDLIFAKQNNCCAICKSTESFSRAGGYMHVDHCHTTGKIRGILCQPCNVTLGKMKDSPELLRKAADYLEKYN